MFLCNNRCCHFPSRYPPSLRVRYHPFPTSPLLRLDLTVSKFTLRSDRGLAQYLLPSPIHLPNALFGTSLRTLSNLSLADASAYSSSSSSRSSTSNSSLPSSSDSLR